MQQQVDMQQTQHRRDSKAITTPPMILETKLVSGGPFVGEKAGLVTMGEVKIDTPVGTAEQRSM